MKKGSILLFIIINCALFGCAISNNSFSNKNLAPFDLNDLNHKLNDYPKEKNLMQRNIDENPIYKGLVDVHFEKGDLSIRLFETSISDFMYSEYNKKNGSFVLIYGVVPQGYTIATGNKKNTDVLIKDYYSSGKIFQVKELYSGIYPEGLLNLEAFGDRRLLSVEFPVGKTLTYDEDGKLISTVDCNQLLKFRLTDVKRLLRQKKIDLKNIQIIKGDVEQGGCSAFWSIAYSKLNDGKCTMLIDAKTGKIIKEEHHLEDRKKHPLI